MTNAEIMQALSTLLVQGQNNYHISVFDIKQAEYSLNVLNNIMATCKKLQAAGKNEV